MLGRMDRRGGGWVHGLSGVNSAEPDYRQESLTDWLPPPSSRLTTRSAEVPRRFTFSIPAAIPAGTGVCSDEIIRSYRALAVDLQTPDARTGLGDPESRFQQESHFGFPTFAGDGDYAQEGEVNPEKLQGTIEADELYLGGKPRYKATNRARAFAEKIPVAGAVQRGGVVRFKMLQRVTSDQPGQLIAEKRRSVVPTHY